MWLIFAVLTAFFTATSACIAKFNMRQNDEYVVGWMRLLFSCPFLLLLLLWVKIPSLDDVFYKTLLIILPLEMLTYMLYLKAVKISPLSLTMPFLAITPVLVIVTSSVVLAESLSVIGIAGILLIAFGSYVLNIDKVRFGFLGPIKAIFQERGSLYMVIVASVFSVTAVLCKQLIVHSSAMFVAGIYFPILMIFFVPIILVRQKKRLIKINNFKKNLWFFVLAGIVFALTFIFHCLAMSKTNTAYMIAVKRSSLLFGVMYGAVIFKESNIRHRLLGASVMLMGIVLISFA